MILVTGGAGFIGSQLAARLVRDGRRVALLDSFDPWYDPAVKRANVAPLLEQGVALVEGDVREPEAIGRALAGRDVDAIVHLAARAGVRPSLAEPALYADVNVTGTLRLLEAARAAGIGHVVVASSSSVYGDARRMPLREDEREGPPASPYGASKLAMEVVAETFAARFPVRVTALRFFTAYGPRQRPDMAIHRFARAILEGRPIELFGRGDTLRDYTYVDDVVDGIVRSMARGGAPFRAYNLGREEPVELGRLVDELERALGMEAIRRHVPEQPGDVRVTAADCTRARDELGYAPQVSLEAGLAAFVAWLRR